MSSNSNTPRACPYCGEPTDKLTSHLPCDAVPPTEGYADE